LSQIAKDQLEATSGKSKIKKKEATDSQISEGHSTSQIKVFLEYKKYIYDNGKKLIQ
jgi:hypothetical protein